MQLSKLSPLLVAALLLVSPLRHVHALPTRHGPGHDPRTPASETAGSSLTESWAFLLCARLLRHRGGGTQALAARDPNTRLQFRLTLGPGACAHVSQQDRGEDSYTQYDGSARFGAQLQPLGKRLAGAD